MGSVTVKKLNVILYNLITSRYKDTPFILYIFNFCFNSMREKTQNPILIKRIGFWYVLGF